MLTNLTGGPTDLEVSESSDHRKWYGFEKEWDPGKPRQLYRSERDILSSKTGQHKQLHRSKSKTDVNGEHSSL